MQTEADLIERAVALARSGHVRQGAHMLRERLVLDPHNLPIRQALATIYRDGGHPDQAGRYEFGITSGDPSDHERYLVWLAGIRADEARIRQLSVLPDDVPTPQVALKRLEELSQSLTTHEPWESMGWVGAMASLVLALATTVIVYFTVLFGGSFALSVARIGGLVTVAALIVSAVGFTGSCWKSGSRRAAMFWGIIAVVLATLLVAGAIALLT